MAGKKEGEGEDDDLARLQADIERLKNDLAEVHSTLKGIGRDRLERLQAEGGERFENLKREFDEIAGAIQSSGREQVSAVERQVKENPILSLLAAFGIGMLLSRLLDRR